MKKFFIMILSILTIGLVSCASNNSSDTTTSQTATPEIVDKDEYKLKITSPGGAPGVAISELATIYDDSYSFTIGVDPSALGGLFNNKTEDIILAPINLGAMQYKKNGNYVLGSVLTWGNLYIASQRPNFTLADLNNNELIAFKMESINGTIVSYVLESNNIKPSNIESVGGTQITQSRLIADDKAICVVAEPALTAARMQKPNITAISVQELYKNASGNNEFPQAGCFIKKDSIDKHKTIIDKFLVRLNASALFTKTELNTVAEYAERLELGKKKALVKAIPNCNIKYVSALEARDEIEFVVALDKAKFGGAAPEDSFYYAG